MRLLPVIALSPLWFGALAQAGYAQSPAAARGAAPAEIVRVVDSVARRAIDAGVLAGLGLAVVKEGRVILEQAYGYADRTRGIPADRRTLWYTASTTKSFTGFGISLLADAGTLSLTTPIPTLLPNARWHPDARADELTLERFLSHTHHLDGGGSVVMASAFTGAIPESRYPLLLADAAPTGSTDLVYSNLGYNVAGMVLDQIWSAGWRDYLEQRVFRPAGMTETWSRVSAVDADRIARPHALTPAGGFRTTVFEKADATMHAAGGHLATLHDLARWAMVQMDGGMLDGRRVFPASAVALSHRMIAPQTRDQARRFAWFDRAGWSAGWDIGSYEGEPMVSRFGGYQSLRSHLSFLPRRRIGVVAMASGGMGSSVTDLLAALAYDLDAGLPSARSRATARLDSLVGQLPAARRRVAEGDSVRASRQVPMDRPLSRFAGEYQDPSYGVIAFELRGDALRFHWGVLSGPVEILDASRHEVRIEIGGTGTPVAFTFSDRNAVASGVTINSIRFARVGR